MLAITTTFRGPTDFQGSRILASCDGRRLVVGYDHALSNEENHLTAARAFLAKHLPRHSINLSGFSKPGVYAHIAELVS